MTTLPAGMIYNYCGNHLSSFFRRSFYQTFGAMIRICLLSWLLLAPLCVTMFYHKDKHDLDVSAAGFVLISSLQQG